MLVRLLCAVCVEFDIQGPLAYGYRNKTGSAETMLYCALERIGAAELRVDNDKLDGPVHYCCQSHEKDDTRD
jgi:hypothetical protein